MKNNQEINNLVYILDNIKLPENYEIKETKIKKDTIILTISKIEPIINF